MSDEIDDDDADTSQDFMEMARRARDIEAATPRIVDAPLRARDLYSARNAGPLHAAMSSVKGAMARLDTQLGAMSNDADFAAIQAAIVAALNGAITTVSAATPAYPKAA